MSGLYKIRGCFVNVWVQKIIYFYPSVKNSIPKTINLYVLNYKNYCYFYNFNIECKQNKINIGDILWEEKREQK